MASKVSTDEETFKEVVHYITGKICEEQAQETGVVFTKQAIASISEISYRQFALFANDLELFTKHARRKRINAEDVLMLVRRSPSLHKHLSKMRSDGKG